MVVAKKLLLSAGLAAYATAAVIPQRRSHTHVARILPEGAIPAPKAAPAQPGVEKPILDLSKIKKVGQAKVEADKDDVARPKPKDEDKVKGKEAIKNEVDRPKPKGEEKVKDKGKGIHGVPLEYFDLPPAGGGAVVTTTDGAETTTSELPTETTAPPPGQTDAPPQDDQNDDQEQENDEDQQNDENQNDQEGEDQQNQPPADGPAATKGLLVQFVVPEGQAAAFEDVLVGAVPAIEAEPLTLSWFGATLNNASDNFLVFDTFADDAGRAAHLGGEVAASVIAQAPNFVGGLSIDAFDILAIKNADPALANTVTLGLHAAFEAQEDQIADVQQFCTDSLAIAEAEAGTINWLCGQWPGTAKFLILDSFVDQAGLDAHLAGEIAQNLVGLAEDTLVAAPTIDQINIVAASVKTGAAPDEDVDLPPPAGGGAAAIDVTRASDSLTDSANFGLFVPFTAQPETAAAVQDFVQGATALAAAEPGTLQWFAGVTENVNFVVFDTFATAADRDAHLAGDVAKGLLGQIAALSSVDIVPLDMIALKSLNDDAAVASATSGVTVALQTTFSATSEDRIADVVTLCQSGLQGIQAEAGTVNWACAQITDTSDFAIIASFPTVEDRNAHLEGEFATALVALAAQGNAESFITNLAMASLDIFAGTSKPEVGAGAGAGGDAGDENGAGGDAGEDDEEPNTTSAPAETETQTQTTTSESATETSLQSIPSSPAFLKW